MKTGDAGKELAIISRQTFREAEAHDTNK